MIGLLTFIVSSLQTRLLFCSIDTMSYCVPLSSSLPNDEVFQEAKNAVHDDLGTFCRSHMQVPLPKFPYLVMRGTMFWQYQGGCVSLPTSNAVG